METITRPAPLPWRPGSGLAYEDTYYPLPLSLRHPTLWRWGRRALKGLALASLALLAFCLLRPAAPPATPASRALIAPIAPANLGPAIDRLVAFTLKASGFAIDGTQKTLGSVCRWLAPLKAFRPAQRLSLLRSAYPDIMAAYTSDVLEAAPAEGNAFRPAQRLRLMRFPWERHIPSRSGDRLAAAPMGDKSLMPR